MAELLSNGGISRLNSFDEFLIIDTTIIIFVASSENSNEKVLGRGLSVLLKEVLEVVVVDLTTFVAINCGKSIEEGEIIFAAEFNFLIIKFLIEGDFSRFEGMG